MPTQEYSSIRSYFIFILAAVFLGVLVAVGLMFFAIGSNNESHVELSRKEAVNIEQTISEAFGYFNKISSYVGREIAQHQAKDLQFILRIFRQADKIQNKNSQLLSWSSFDFVAPNNLQLVNSKIGIWKNPPDMSDRQYCDRSRERPWSLQVSFPVFGNPSKSWVIPAGTGIVDDEGKYLGLIAVGINISELTALVEKRLTGESSFVVLDEDFNVIIKSKDLDIGGDDDRKVNLQFEFEKDFGVILDGLLVGKVRFFYYQKFEGYPYVVLSGFNEALLAKEFNNSILPIIGGSLVITIFFLMILYLLKERILFLVSKEKDLEASIVNKEFLLNSKTKLIRATSHDLKNYIFGISGLSKLIIEGKEKSEIEGSEDLKMVEELHHQSEELMGFVEDLLDTNQSEDGEFKLGRMEVFDIIELLRRMVILNRNFAIENRIGLELDNRSGLEAVGVLCDVRRVKQIVNNLISNAIKYSNQGGVVILQVSLIAGSGEVCVAVIDQGIGMSGGEIEMALVGDGEQISKVGLNKAFDSHGIGMPIIKRLIELHKGRLEINSVKRCGTEVKIYLSVCDSGEELVGRRVYPTNSLNDKFKNKAVLIAEDNAITNKVVTFLLRKMGFYVKHVENGEEILEQLDKQHFDLIFLDINMPKLGGFETAEAIRKGEIFKRFKNYDIPIIAISTEKQELSNIKLHGINMLLGKPFSEKELIDFVMGSVKT